MLNVGDLKELLEDVDDETLLSVDLTNITSAHAADIIAKKRKLRISGVWLNGIDGDSDSLVLVGFASSFRFTSVIPRLKLSKTSQKLQPL